LIGGLARRGDHRASPPSMAGATASPAGAGEHHVEVRVDDVKHRPQKINRLQ